MNNRIKKKPLHLGRSVKAGIKLDRYGLIVLSGGNVSLRVEKDKILVTPSGMIYEEMVTDDIILMDLTGNVPARVTGIQCIGVMR